MIQFAVCNICKQTSHSLPLSFRGLKLTHSPTVLDFVPRAIFLPLPHHNFLFPSHIHTTSSPSSIAAIQAASCLQVLLSPLFSPRVCDATLKQPLIRLLSQLAPSSLFHGSNIADFSSKDSICSLKDTRKASSQLLLPLATILKLTRPLVALSCPDRKTSSPTTLLPPSSYHNFTLSTCHNSIHSLQGRFSVSSVLESTLTSLQTAFYARSLASYRFSPTTPNFHSTTSHNYNLNIAALRSNNSNYILRYVQASCLLPTSTLQSWRLVVCRLNLPS